MASTSVVFDVIAKDRASDKFDHLGRSISGTETKMSKFTGVMKTAGKAAAYGLGAGLVVAAGSAVKFAQAAADDQVAAEQLEGQLKRNADASDEQVAATERWIAAQGKALGVTDDELRPALGALVTATHDVGKAQMLASLAMDVSAARGKNLSTVSEALMKAQNGNAGALEKLGVNTKNAAGEVLPFTELVKRMSDQFGGAASEKAETFQGKMDRLKLMLSETGEAIGYKLIPVATKLMDWITGTGIPAVEQFTAEWKKSVGTGGQVRDVLSKIGTTVKNVAKFLWDHKVAVAAVMAAYVAFKTVMLGVKVVQAAQLVLLKAHTIGTIENRVATIAASAASKAWAAAQWLLNAALTANPIGLVVVGIGLLVAGFVLAYKKSETFREGVNKVWTVLKRFIGFTPLGPLIANFGAVRDAVGYVVDKVKELIGWISKIHVPDIHLPSKPDWLPRMAPGGNSIDVGNPGAALISSIVKGIEKGKVKLSVVLDKLKGYIQKHQARLADLLGQRASILDAFKGFTSSIFGADTGFEASKQIQADIASLNDGILDKQKALAKAQEDLAKATADGQVEAAASAAERIKEIQDDIAKDQGKVSTLQAQDAAAPKGIDALLAYQAQAKQKAETLRDSVKALITKGISRDLLTQLQNQGESGQEQINLLASATEDQIKQANADNAATQQALQEAGLAASKAQGIEDAIAQEQANIKLADTIKGGLKELLDEQDKNTVVELHLDGHRILWSLKKIKKQNGGHLGLGDKDND